MKCYMAAAAAAVLVLSAGQGSFGADIQLEVVEGGSTRILGGSGSLDSYGLTHWILDQNNSLFRRTGGPDAPGLSDAFDGLEMARTPVGILLRGPSGQILVYDQLSGQRVLQVLGIDPLLPVLDPRFPNNGVGFNGFAPNPAGLFPSPVTLAQPPLIIPPLVIPPVIPPGGGGDGGDGGGGDGGGGGGDGVIPEPASALLLTGGVLLLVVRNRRSV